MTIRDEIGKVRIPALDRLIRDAWQDAEKISSASREGTASVVNQEDRPHTDDMSTSVNTELLDAKLQVIETRMDARIQRIEDKMDAFVEANKETQASVKGLKLTLVVTAISTVLAIVLGVAAFNSTVLSNMVAAFESGKSTSAAQAQVQQQLRDTQALLDSIKQQQSTPSK